ncbi:hypothetical protein FHS72_001232 [Loktanella ponticola]|uniref:Uncharacterized protein n=1 Tax=Yoonia ponticola TaxID=1524255 RepID=A0A7W9BJF9_9RHOB|nr:hypothetical protein [Yoonia ponticola]MBB5721620.1 hypothetical protein [Yoonia ponticola]
MIYLVIFGRHAATDLRQWQAVTHCVWENRLGTFGPMTYANNDIARIS